MDEFFTLADAKAADIGNSVGYCSSSAEFLRDLNWSQKRLMLRGDFSRTVVPIHMCVRSGCVTWPRFVGQVRRMNICGKPMPMRNIYSEYLDRSIWPAWFNFPSSSQWPYYWQHSANWPTCGVAQTGYYSTYADPQGTRYIRAYPQWPGDIGKTVTVFGKDDNGQPLVHENSDGTHSPGVIITLANPFGSTSIQIQTPIDRVIKDATDGQVWLYAYNADLDELEDLAVYQPTEKNPTYARHRVPGWRSTSDSCNAGVMAMAKLKHIDLVNDTDLVLIPSLSALEMMMQARFFEQANDTQHANEYEARAIRELNLQLRDDMPENQTAVSVEPFNSTWIGPQQCF